MDAFEEDLDQAIGKFHKAVVKFISSLGFFCLTVMERIQLQYEADGSPYGNTPDGMYKWAAEKMKTVSDVSQDDLKDSMMGELQQWLESCEPPEDHDDD